VNLQQNWDTVACISWLVMLESSEIKYAKIANLQVGKLK